jgi:O-antigen/teichoic acid export membrane protein
MKRFHIFLRGLRGRQEPAIALGKALSISVLNQAVSSCTNFALSVYLVRVLSPTEFGLYGIGFAISLFYAGIGNALFLTQMVVHVPDKKLPDRLPYAGRMLTAVVLFCVLTCVVFAAALAVCSFYFNWIARHDALAVSTAAASIAYLLKDFFVRHAYTVRRETWALATNIAVAVSLIMFLTAQRYRYGNIDAVAALSAYALSHLIAASAALLVVRLPLRTVRCEQLAQDMREAWVGGRWYVLVAFTYATQTQAHTMLGAALLGPPGVAAMNAARLFVAPPMLMIPALSQVLLPRMVVGRTNAHFDVVRAGHYASGLMVLISLGYILAVTPILDRLAPIVMGTQYDGLNYTVYSWCAALLMMAARSGPVLTNHATKDFRAFFIASSFSAVLSVIASAIFISSWGVVGGPLGYAVGEATLLLLIRRSRLIQNTNSVD